MSAIEKPADREGAREAILAKVRASLGIELEAPGQSGARSAIVERRIEAPPRHLTPARVLKPKVDLEALFASTLVSQFASVLPAYNFSDVPGAIATYLRQTNLPSVLGMGQDPVLAALPWGVEPGLVVSPGPARPETEVSVSRAIAGAAETGTIFLASGPDNPVTLTFMPATHIVVITANDIVGPYEDAFQVVRKLYGNGLMPRTLNLVSGPSRTADIGGKIVIGAHGPQRLAVVIVRNSRPPAA